MDLGCFSNHKLEPLKLNFSIFAEIQSGDLDFWGVRTRTFEGLVPNIYIYIIIISYKLRNDAIYI